MRFSVDQRGDLAPPAGLASALADRQMDVVDALRLDPAAHVLVVGDDRHQLHRQVADGIAVEQIVEAVAELGDQDQHARLDGEIVQPPVEIEAGGDRQEAAGEFLGGHRRRRRERHAHEEALGLRIAVLGALDDVAVLRGDAVGHRGDDAAPVAAGEGQDETRRFGGHGIASVREGRADRQSL